MGDFLLTGKPSRYITNHTGQHSLPSLPFNRLPAYWLGLRWGVFTCVGWQVTLCDLVWQATSRSSEDGSLLDLSVHGRGQCPFLQNFRFLILKIRIFVDCLALKFIFLYTSNQKMPKWPYTWDAMRGSWRWTCGNKKQTIHCQWMIWSRVLQRPPRGLKFTRARGGSSNQLGGSTPLPDNSSTDITVAKDFKTPNSDRSARSVSKRETKEEKTREKR